LLQLAATRVLMRAHYGAAMAIATHSQVASARLSAQQVWGVISRNSFAVLSHVTPGGAPRSSGVVYTTVDRRLFVVVGRNSWKARHIALSGRVAMTVTVRRGGVLSLLFPIPPAAISFEGTAIVYQPETRQTANTPEALEKLAPMLPPYRREEVAIIEIVPEGYFLTYGIDVSLMQMRDPTLASARVPVT
jgi:hypothetical protein